MSSSSIYRGPSSSGLGEAPGVSVDHGEQFLAAAPDLWKNAPDGLIDQIRSWLTLDARGQDYSLLGEKLEAWSCFPFEHPSRGMRFVVRLAGAGTYDRRAAYFAHGRAWPAAECRPDNDPGTLIGRTDAFSQPWRDHPIPFEERAAEPEANEWRRVLESEPEKLAAASLLAYLYQARVTRIPVVLAVPIREFVTGSPLHKLVAFARAALPWELKQDSRIRVYTSMPSTYLQNLKADLIVIPEDLAGEAMRVSPDAILLDRAGKLYAGTGSEGGRQISPYTRYAEAVVDRFLDSPAELFVPALFPFTGRVVAGVDIPVNGAPPGPAMASVANIYDVVATAGDEDHADKLLRFLFRQANKNAKIAQPWESMIPAGDWAKFPPDAIREVVCSEPGTEDAAALQRCVRLEARRRELRIELPQGATPARVLQFLADGFVSEAEATRRVRECDAKDIFEVLGPGSGVTETLVNLLGSTQLPAEWARRFPLLGTAGEAVERLISAATCTTLAGSPWESPLHDALGRLLREGIVSPQLAEQLSRFPQPSSTYGRLLIVEVLFRSKPETAKSRIDQVFRALEREGRRWIVQHLDDTALTCLRDVSIPVEWDRDVADLWLQASENRIRQLTPARLVRLLDPHQPMSHSVTAILDSHFENETSNLKKLLSQERAQSVTALNLCMQTTNALIDNHLWMRWRCVSRVLPGTFRICAKAWVMANRGREVLLEDWKRVMLDLEHLEVREIFQMKTQCESQVFRWPIVRMFDEEQLDDLIALVGENPSALSQIAATTDTEYRKVQQRANLNAPEGFLQHLNSNSPLPASWSIEGLRQFLVSAPAGTRAISRAADAIAARLWENPQAVSLVGEFQLWQAPNFLWRLLESLSKRQIGAASAQALERSIGSFPAAPRSRIALADLRWAADYYRELNCPGIAQWLYPVSGTEALYRDAWESLISGDGRRPVWSQIASIVAQRSVADPLGELLAQLWHMDANQLSRVDRHGPGAFRQACADHPILLSVNRRGRVPALQLAAFLRPHDSIGSISASLLHLGVCWRPPEIWWRAFLDTVRDCPRRSGFPNQDRFDDAIASICWTAKEQFRGEDQWMTKALLKILEERGLSRARHW